MTALEYRAGTGDWRERAACRDSDPEAWFDGSPREREAAERVCITCPVRLECIAYALDREVADGMWGGFDFHDRRNRAKALALLVEAS